MIVSLVVKANQTSRCAVAPLKQVGLLSEPIAEAVALLLLKIAAAFSGSLISGQ
jgi:hypothetical protein